MMFNPIFSLFNTLKNLILGRIHFPKSRIGEVIRTDSGEELTVFRQVIIGRQADYLDHPGALFHVKFHLKGMSPETNKRFSLIPIPLFVGLPGFRGKMWALNERNGDFHGFYEWESLAHAQKYSKLFAMRFMAGRSLPGSVDYEIREFKAVEDLKIRPTLDTITIYI